MSAFVIQQVHSPGASARADEATTFAMTVAAINSEVVMGRYLVWSDPDAKGGRGDDKWSTKLAKAKRFPTHDAAFECWRAQSKAVPFRPDGKPNRPMTAYTVQIVEVD